jgi:hypothetical protein
MLNAFSRFAGRTMTSLYGTRPGYGAGANLGDYGNRAQAPRTYYGVLAAYYSGGDDLYADISRAMFAAGVHPEAILPLRNPAYRTVEFYVAKIWPGTLPGALPLETDNPRLAPAVEQVWTWSNWGSQKQVFVRFAATYGDVFVKVCQRQDGSRVYFQLIDPAWVPDFDTDERGYLTRIRVDTPLPPPPGTPPGALAAGTLKRRTRTEVWTKAPGTYRVWEHELDDEPDLERLGDPVESRPLSDFGIDFLPFVHCQFKDVGQQRGQGAFAHALLKIDEGNRSATRLHQMLYRHNKNTWVLEGDAPGGGDGRPGALPPPKIAGLNGSSSADGGTVDVGDESLYSLPAGWHLRSQVPDVNYADALTILNAHLAELERDLPELVYGRLHEFGDLSGRAVRLLMSGAIDRALEARGQCEDALIRCHQMALTIGANAGLAAFRGVGTFESGALDHSIAERDILPPDALEQAQADKAAAEAAVVRLQLGWSKRKVQEELGLSPQEIDEMAAEAEADAGDAADRLLSALDRGTLGASDGANGTGRTNGVPPGNAAGTAAGRPGG